MNAFEVTGGKKLNGEITPQGAKNEALQIICATLLTVEPMVIHNIPGILDVNKLIEQQRLPFETGALLAAHRAQQWEAGIELTDDYAPYDLLIGATVQEGQPEADKPLK